VKQNSENHIAAEPSSEEAPGNLAEWVAVLTEKELPVFARTVSNVSRVAGNPEASASHLARAISSDAAMAAKLLKIANSPVFSAGLDQIRTINRAVVVLGFESVRKLAISLAVIENVLAGQNQDSVMREMATAFHTASQAQGLAVAVLGPRDGDEIFVAGLLYQIGQLAFLGSSDPRVDQYLIARDAMSDAPEEFVRTERRLLGVELKQLSLQLAEQWSLGDTLKNALSGRNDAAGRMVSAGHHIAETVARHGWDAPVTRKLLKDTAKRLKLDANALTEQVQERAESARKAASDCGAERVAPFIPQPAVEHTESTVPVAVPSGEASTDDAPMSAAHAKAEPNTSFLRPDPALQLDILHKLSEQREEKPDFNGLMHLVMDGIHRGIGMDRTVFGLLTPKRDHLAAKYALGDSQAELKQAFNFALSADNNALLHRVVHRNDTLWITKDSPRHLRTLLRGDFAQFCGDSDFMIQPVLIGDKPIGVLYTDRQPSARHMEESDFRSFRQFGKQALLGLRMLDR